MCWGDCLKLYFKSDQFERKKKIGRTLDQKLQGKASSQWSATDPFCDQGQVNYASISKHVKFQGRDGLTSEFFFLQWKHKCLLSETD